MALERVSGHYALSGGVAERSLALRSTDVVVDVGGGTGGVAARLAGRVRRIVVVEPSASLARRGSRRRRAVGFVIGDGRRVPLRDGSADQVLLIEVLHHVADADTVLAEAARILKPGGAILIEESEFTGMGGAIRGWVERRLFGGVWPRTREGLARVLVRLGLACEAVEREGFVIVARRAASRDGSLTGY